MGTVEQRLAGGQICITAKALTQFLHALFGSFATGDNTHQIRTIHDWDTNVVENQVQDIFVELAFFKQFHRRNAQPLTKD